MRPRRGIEGTFRSTFGGAVPVFSMEGSNRKEQPRTRSCSGGFDQDFSSASAVKSGFLSFLRRLVLHK
jgi:hypothetical protein